VLLVKKLQVLGKSADTAQQLEYQSANDVDGLNFGWTALGRAMKSQDGGKAGVGNQSRKRGEKA
jgi:hypothetical protein